MQVHITGIADFGDVDNGTLDVVNQSDGTVAVSLSSEREKVTAAISPEDSTATRAPVGTSGTTDVKTYKLKVESVKMVSATCSGDLAK